MRVRFSQVALVTAMAVFASGTGQSAPAAPQGVPGADICRSPVGRANLPVRSGTQPFTADTIPAAPPIHLEVAPPLLSGLGPVSMGVTTASSEAQRYFNQGLRLTYAFNHAEARRAFRHAQRLDPECAMCWWGEALVLGPNINAPMSAEAVAPAMQAMGRARALASDASPREQALIAALSRRYSHDATADRAALDRAWADAIGAVAASYPLDDNVAVLFAEALMNLSPWDYWQPDGETPRGRTAEAVVALERVMARNAAHTGAIHYYIHLVEASTTPERALPHARRLAALAPEAGHLVHMPSHIYFRLGMYRDALHANVDAVAADERYFRLSASDPFYRNGYYPHNLHFLMAAAQMGGDGELALSAAAKLGRVIDPTVVRVAPVLQPVMAAPYFTHAQFSAPARVLELPDPGEEFVLVQAMWHYARAVAHAARSEIGAGEAEAERIGALLRDPQLVEIEDGGVPARDVLRIAYRVAQARLSDARGDLPAAAALYREAVAIQDGLPYMEPPWWYYPVRQSLGGVLLRMGDISGAEQAFRDTLAQVPNNAWALFGLQQTHRRQDDLLRMREVTQRLEEAWFADPSVLNLRRL